MSPDAGQAGATGDVVTQPPEAPAAGRRQRGRASAKGSARGSAKAKAKSASAKPKAKAKAKAVAGTDATNLDLSTHLSICPACSTRVFDTSPIFAC